MTNQKIKCLVVDDEPIAREIVATYLKQSTDLEWFGECKNALEAIEILQSNNDIGIVFLDINLPNLSGISMLKILKMYPQIIFTTAYHEYAVESYELDAVDYILKPFSYERFTKAVFKAVNRIENIKLNSPIQIKSDGKIHFIDKDDILFCEAMRNYTRVFLKNGVKLMPLISLSKFGKELFIEDTNFIKVHRSFIVAKNHITFIKLNVIMINDYKVPIGIQFKEEFMKSISK